VNQYLKTKRVPHELKARIQDYYAHRYEQHKLFNELEILRDLSEPLAIEICLHNCRDLVQKVPFFFDAHPEFIRAVVRKLRPMVFLKGDRIIRQGSKGDKMYFIRKGRVEIFSMETGSVATTISSGSYFGEIALLSKTPGTTRNATVRAVNAVELYSLSHEDLHGIISEYPELQSAMEKIATLRLHKLQTHMEEQRKAVKESVIRNDLIHEALVEEEEYETTYRPKRQLVPSDNRIHPTKGLESMSLDGVSSPDTASQSSKSPDLNVPATFSIASQQDPSSASSDNGKQGSNDVKAAATLEMRDLSTTKERRKSPLSQNE